MCSEMKIWQTFTWGPHFFSVCNPTPTPKPNPTPNSPPTPTLNPKPNPTPSSPPTPLLTQPTPNLKSVTLTLPPYP